MDTFFKIQELINKDLHCCVLAVINSFDNVNMKANITLLNKFKYGNKFVELPPIDGVPVSCVRTEKFIIRPPYKVGDCVMCIINDVSIEKMLINNYSSEPKRKKMHSLEDMIIIGGLTLENGVKPNSGNENDLVIQNIATQTGIVIKENGDIVLGNITATEGMVFGNKLETWIKAVISALATQNSGIGMTNLLPTNYPATNFISTNNKVGD